jgi:phosphoadenosine phosphosulfate reductase
MASGSWRIMATTTRAELDDKSAQQGRDFGLLSDAMENWSPQRILAWAIEQYGSRLAFATAFGAEGCALIAMMSQIPGFDKAYLFNLETGYQFPETLELRERIQERYGLRVHLVSSDESVPEMEQRFGGTIYDKDPDQCCNIRKVVPLRKVIADYGAWVTAIRRDQSAARRDAPIVGWDSKFDLVKVNPLANWTSKQVWKYVIENDVPYNPLHDQGYASIGCWPCTRAVGAGEDDRAGRWSGMAKTECGLHAPIMDKSQDEL